MVKVKTIMEDEVCEKVYGKLFIP
jgi:hypothetical protein